MKRFFLSTLFFAILSSAVFAQSSAQDTLSKKVVLTIRHHGQSENFSIDDYSFSFSKMDAYQINGHAMRGDLMVTLEKYSPFLLQAVGGDSTNVINVQLAVYTRSGEKEGSIQMDHALIRSTTNSYQSNYGTNLSLDIAAPDVVINDVEL